ncbi:hypothetical protein DUZ99_11775 [Xylanibacillus composti]|uniref:N-acyl amino acid synthase FeeM catalytic core domain-containing protein n=1 Tax=Xylanibacillus composti TaxID=1572762 RepID=A0A8J4M1Q2_9BACL|nr:acyl-homoserine-lactone synthase [Xylanibacillus composti]MDT9725652.1 hypothetical protein [Xylanibacillus composti]GIQ67746.1 hypothetical protein XYCOK13_05700 [Xylanibacillus composti]
MNQDSPYVYAVAEGDIRSQAVNLHHQRYQEVGFFKPDEYDPYEQQSVYFVAQMKERGEVVGVTRLILDSLDRLPTMRSFTIFDLERARLSMPDMYRVAEISAFTKLQQHDVGLGLIKAIFKYSLIHGISNWICCIDERVYTYMKRVFKFPFQIIGEPRVYLGSKSIPCSFHIAECQAALQRLRPELYAYFIDFENQSLREVR